MAVTDLTDSLPWWARSGAGPSGGPGAAPQGSGGAPGANGTDWLQYLSQMFGISPAQAAPLMASMQQQQQQQQVPPDDHGDNALSMDQALQLGQNPPPPQPPPDVRTIVQPQQNGPAPGQSILPQARGVSNPPFPPDTPAPAGPSILPQARGAAVQPGPMAAGNSILPQGAAQASSPMGPPIPPGGLPKAAAPPGPMATGNRFIGIDAPNASPQNSLRGGPQGTALNLAGLFGGGQGAAPAAAAPAAAALVRGPMAKGGVANAPMPPIMPDDIRRQRAIQLAAARSGFA